MAPTPLQATPGPCTITWEGDKLPPPMPPGLCPFPFLEAGSTVEQGPFCVRSLDGEPW